MAEKKINKIIKNEPSHQIIEIFGHISEINNIIGYFYTYYIINFYY